MKAWRPLVFFSLFCLFPKLSLAADTFNSDNTAAHFFAPSANDQSLVYLGEIFGSIPPVLAGAGSDLLGQVFRIFNTAVLSISIFFIAYTTFVSLLNAAGDGESMGKKWSSMWVMIRLTAGVALVIPTQSGYCMSQVFIMWIITQGIGMADHLNSVVMDYMKSGQPVYVAGATAQNSGTTTLNSYNSTISDLYQGLTCMQALKKLYPEKNPGNIKPPVAAETSEGIVYTFAANGEDGEVTCGTMFINSPYGKDADSFNLYLPYLEQGLEAIMPSLNAAAYYMVNYDPVDPNDDVIFEPTYTTETTSEETDTLQATYDIVGSGFLQQVSQTYASYLTQGQYAAAHGDPDESNTSLFDDIKAYGWVSLGTVYWKMSKSSSYEDYNITYGKITWGENGNSGNHNTTSPDNADFDDSSVKAYTLQWAPQFITNLVDTQNDQAQGTSAFNKVQDKGTASNSAALFTSLIVNAAANAMINDLAKKNQNPLLAAQHVGHHIIFSIELSFSIIMPFVLGAAILAGLGSGTTPYFLAAQTLFTMLFPGILVFVFFIYALGAMLAVAVPFIPALIYFMAVLGWMVAVVEAEIAAPILSLGLVHPEGQHDMWGKAEPAIMLMITLFLRPSMIVIAMCAAILVSFVGSQFLNFAFMAAANSMFSSSHPTAVEMALVLAVYVGMVMAVVNKAFSMIDSLPDQFMRWIQGGSSARHGQGLSGDLDKIAEVGDKGLKTAAEHGAGRKKQASEMGEKGLEIGDEIAHMKEEEAQSLADFTASKSQKGNDNEEEEEEEEEEKEKNSDDDDKNNGEGEALKSSSLGDRGDKRKRKNNSKTKDKDINEDEGPII